MTIEKLHSEPVTGVIIVDHGSRRTESNAMLHQAAERFAADSPYPIVEPAHMELAEPSIATAFGRCVERGAKRIVVFPYFLSPGRHWTEDIPTLVAGAAKSHSNIEWLITAPFGLHPGMNAIITDRINRCLRNASGMQQHESAPGCDVCNDGAYCRYSSSSNGLSGADSYSLPNQP